MHEWSDREPIPQFDEVSALLGRPPAFLSSWRPWAIAGMAVMLLAAIRVYKQDQALTQRAETVEETSLADAQLMEAVNAHLSRTLPTPMEPILKLIPGNSTPNGGIQ